MKRCKRTLALLLSAVLCLTALPVSASAAEDWPETTDPIETCFTTGSKGSAESTGRFPVYSDGDRTTWTLSDGVLVIDGTGKALDAYDHLFDGNAYVETVIVKENVENVGANLFRNMPNLKNVIVMSNQTYVNKIVLDCPNMNNFIIGANLDNEPVKCLPEDIDRVKVTLGGLTGMAGGSASVARPVPIANRIIISSDYGNVTTLTNEAAALIAKMNLPASALALLPTELTGGAAVETPVTSEPAVSTWAQTYVDTAETSGFIPAETLGNDYTESITRAEFAALAVQTYETISGNEISYTASNFADCTNNEAVSKAYALGILAGYNSAESTSDVRVGPDNLITREQAATMLARLSEKLGKPMTAADSLPFTDNIADWAYENVAKVYDAGVMAGTSATTFSGSANYTIEQSVVTMVRIAEFVG